MTPPAWSSRDDGRSEREWLRDIPWPDLGRLDLHALVRRWPRLVVVAPHPDDETLAVGGLIAACTAAGGRVDVLLLTDGEASHPGSRTLDRECVRRVRLDEFDAAVRRLGVSGEVRALHVPDGAVAQHAESVEAELRAFVRGSGVPSHDDSVGDNDNNTDDDNNNDDVVPATLVLAPCENDGHADHDAAGELSRRVARASGVGWVGYPLWLWHWGTRDDFDWATTVLVPLPVAALDAKAEALAGYASQTSTFGQPAAEPALLHPGVVRRFERVVETLVDPQGCLPRTAPDASSDRGAPFDAMFSDATDDPWGVETRWYERRKQAIVEAMLPHERLGRVLDVGCSTGVLTRALAARATSVLALDASERALEVARSRDTSGGRIAWRRTELPRGLGDIDASGGEPGGGPFDLVVLSEVGYFFDGPDLMTLFQRVEALLARDGAVVTVNWQHPTQGIPLDGRIVDRQFRAPWPATARYADADVVVTLHDRAAEGET